MDIYWIIGAIIVGLLVIAFILNRAWGNSIQPPRLDQYKQAEYLQTPPRSDSFQSAFSTWDTEPEPEQPVHVQAHQPTQPAFDPNEPIKPMLVTNAQILKVAEQALQNPSSREAQYFMRNGDEIYMVFDHITDPREREMVHRFVSAFTNGQAMGVFEMMKAVAMITKKR